MSDITKCGGFDCPMKDRCKRFTAPANEHMQAYFLDPPYNNNEGGFSCEMYWGENAEGIWNTLQEAVGIQIPNSNDDKDHNL
jgi:16S rRNA G966 N2-methylase RsmD